jgi:hypothetical protein
LQSDQNRLVRRLRVCREIHAKRKAWEHRSLAADAVRRKLRAGDHGSGFLCCADLRHY